MRHVVLTRFNVRLTKEHQLPDETWLRDRIELFERFTAPSIAAQSVQPDSWIVFCAAESPSWLMDRLERVATVHPVEGVFTPEDAAEAVCGADGTLITTRLDNDDAIATNYLEIVQRVAPSEGFLNLSRGLALVGNKLFRRSHLSNAFISRVERCRYDTVMAAGKHSRIAERFDVRQAKTAPSWLQVIHGRNLVNTVGGFRTSRDDLERFDIDAEVTHRGLRVDQIRCLALAGVRFARHRDREFWELAQ